MEPDEFFESPHTRVLFVVSCLERCQFDSIVKFGERVSGAYPVGVLQENSKLGPK